MARHPFGSDRGILRTNNDGSLSVVNNQSEKYEVARIVKTPMGVPAPADWQETEVRNCAFDIAVFVTAGLDQYSARTDDAGPTKLDVQRKERRLREKLRPI